MVTCNIWVIYLPATNVYFFLLIIGHRVLPIGMSSYSFIIWQKVCIEEPQNLKWCYHSSDQVSLSILGRWVADNLKPIKDSAGLGVGCSFRKICVSPLLVYLCSSALALPGFWEPSRSLSAQCLKNTRGILSEVSAHFLILRSKELKNTGKHLQEEFKPVFEFGTCLLPSPFICLFVS